MPLADLDDVTSFCLWIHGSPIWFGPAATRVVSYLFCVHLWKKHKVGNIGPDMGVSFCLKTNRILQKTSPLGNAKETLRFPLGFCFRQALQRNRPVKQRSFSVFKNFQHWYTRSRHRIPFVPLELVSNQSVQKHTTLSDGWGYCSVKKKRPKVSIRDDEKYQTSSRGVVTNLKGRSLLRVETPNGAMQTDCRCWKCRTLINAFVAILTLDHVNLDAPGSSVDQPSLIHWLFDI